jgi:hypothetical protein
MIDIERLTRHEIDEPFTDTYKGDRVIYAT